MIHDPIDTNMWCKVQNVVYNKGYDIDSESYFIDGFKHCTGKYILYKRYNLIFINIPIGVIKFEYSFEYDYQLCKNICIILIKDVSRKSYKKIQNLMEYLFQDFDNIKVEITLNCKN